jgi:hypothetical protein
MRDVLVVAGADLQERLALVVYPAKILVDPDDDFRSDELAGGWLTRSAR